MPWIDLSIAIWVATLISLFDRCDAVASVDVLTVATFNQFDVRQSMLSAVAVASVDALTVAAVSP